MFTIRAERIFDGQELIPAQAVAIEDGRIAAILREAPENALDLGDVTLLPGLIDTHVHLAFDAGPDPIGSLDQDGLYDRMRDAALQHLAAGVTTVRDLGDRDYLAVKLSAELTDGPTILSAGPPITTPRGHCWFLGGEASGVEGVRQAVRERAARGATAIKMMITGGEMTAGSHSHLCQYSEAEVRAAADEAHAHGLPITGHAHAGAGIALAIAADFDSIEHCTFITETGIDPDLTLMTAMATRGIYASLTAGVLPGFTPPPAIAQRLAKLFEATRLMHATGVPIVAGSDAGIGPTKPHGILPWAGPNLVDWTGMTPVEALRSLTSLAARSCQIDDQKGKLAPTYDADLLAVPGNPLTDITTLTRPTAIFRKGRRIQPAA
ncbi:metal-dependent hydrolase family protein [Acrocarpospora catenulata]|uniref:metal-dependent hydrolase family protein n=1 Tax=Acrocarpospora catenulata TaxID=2836182 RepID=UPI001BD940FC|nr:amidohydrolase family protein [Acrocarpospora catenulata]